MLGTRKARTPVTVSIDPVITAPTVTAQTADVVSIRWTITMPSTGPTATSLVVDVFDATDTTFTTALRPQQTFTTGIGLGASLNVTFTNLDGMNGVNPRSFVIRATASS